MRATSQDPQAFNDYDGFVEKFKPKKTTDDCYTPANIYEVVKNWACERYGIDESKIIRPFYPGGDYQNEDYTGRVVIDNPPFSIYSKIVEFYLDNNVKFFLFSPSLTQFNPRKRFKDFTKIVTDTRITYANGALIQTSFSTNLEPDNCVIYVCQDLYKKVMAVEMENRKTQKKASVKCNYPKHLIYPAYLTVLCSNGADFKVYANELKLHPALDAQRRIGKVVWGGGALVPDAVVERIDKSLEAAKEHKRQDIITFELSDREREIIDQLTNQ